MYNSILCVDMHDATNGKWRLNLNQSEKEQVFFNLLVKRIGLWLKKKRMFW